jgi:phospholipid/cholesterol/gamma-HCH transport system substrate-binding protein
MSVKPGYFKIGLFVIVAGALILAAVVVFGSGLFSHKKVYFETYFDESVSGLTVGSPVELRGVRIGQVEKVAFIRDEYKLSVRASETPKYGHYVMVLCSVLRENLPDISDEHRLARLEAMVARGLRVRLSPNLLTGQSYLQADYLDQERFKVLDIGWKPRHLYVSSAPGEFTTLKESVDKVLFRLQELDIDKLVATVENVLTSLETAIADARIADISKDVRSLLVDARRQVNDLDTKKISLAAQQTIASADRAVADANVPALSRDLQTLIAEVRQTNGNLQKLLASPKPISGPSNLPEVVARLNKTLGRIDKLILTERPQIEMILANFKDISEDMKDLTGSLKRNPSDLLFSKPPSQSEALK